MKLYHIGRNQDNEIVIMDGSVSRRHAQLVVDADGFAQLIDLNSTNGTFVNGNKVTGQVALKPGDNVRVGEMVFHWEAYARSNEVAEISDGPSWDQQTDSGPAKRNTWKWIAAGAGGLAVVVTVVLLWVLPGGSADPELLKGHWTDNTDTEAWIQFSPDGKYTEGHGPEIIFNNATWSTHGADGVLIKRGPVTVIYQFKVSGNQLSIRRTGAEDLYTRK